MTRIFVCMQTTHQIYNNGTDEAVARSARHDEYDTTGKGAHTPEHVTEAYKKYS